jgi:hypothetical protein
VASSSFFLCQSLQPARLTSEHDLILLVQRAWTCVLVKAPATCPSSGLAGVFQTICMPRDFAAVGMLDRTWSSCGSKLCAECAPADNWRAARSKSRESKLCAECAPADNWKAQLALYARYAVQDLKDVMIGGACPMSTCLLLRIIIATHSGRRICADVWVHWQDQQRDTKVVTSNTTTYLCTRTSHFC